MVRLSDGADVEPVVPALWALFSFDLQAVGKDCVAEGAWHLPLALCKAIAGFLSVQAADSTQAGCGLLSGNCLHCFIDNDGDMMLVRRSWLLLHGDSSFAGRDHCWGPKAGGRVNTQPK